MASSRPPFQQSDRTIRVKKNAREIAEDWTEEAPTNPVIIIDRMSMPDRRPPSTPAPTSTSKFVVAAVTAVTSWKQVVALGLILVFLYLSGKALGWL